MRSWARKLTGIGKVVSFNYPYMKKKKRRPDPMAVLEQAHREAISAAVGRSKSPLILAGKSMGSRVGCHVAAGSDRIARRVSLLICFGYPLRGQSGKLRDEVLLALRQPILFLQGTRDPLCPLNLLDEVRKRMRARSELCVIEGGDHSLAVTKTALKLAGETQADVDRRILAAISKFVESVEHARDAT